MKPEEKKYILENIGRESPKKIAQELNVRERKIIRFLEREKAAVKETPAPQKAKRPSDGKAVFASIAIIMLIGFAVYSNTFQNSFHYDDRLYIVENHVLKDISDLNSIWFFFPTRFITNLTFALNYHFNQLNVFAYHIVNLLIHLAAAISVLWITRLTLSTPRMRDNKIADHAHIIALFAACVFVAHPIQTQAVTYIVQRAASLASLFYLITIGFYVKSRLSRDLRSGSWVFYYIASLASAFMAMFTKEMAITLPFILLLYELIFLKTKDGRNWRLVMPFFLIFLIIPLTMSATGMVNFEKQRLASEPATGISSSEYLFTEFSVLATYLRLLLVPLGQNLDYDYPIAHTLFEPRTLASLLLLAVILAAAIKNLPKYRLMSFCVFWFFIVLLPESSVIPIKDVIFEHRLYLPMVGYALFLPCLVYYIFKGFGRNPVIIAMIMIIACYSGLAYMRNNVWKNEFTLWDDVIRKSPKRARPYNERGLAYENNKMFDQALADYNTAIALNPNYAMTYGNRGNIYYQYKKDPDRALADYNMLAKLNPDDHNVYNNRGCLYKDKGDLDRAISDFDKSIQLNPKNVRAYFNRALAYAVQAKYDRAISDFDKSMQMDHNNAPAYYFRGVAYFYKNEYEKSEADMNKAKSLGYNPPSEFVEQLRGAVSGNKQPEK